MLEEDLRAKLRADSAVAALVPAPAGIMWGDRAQASALPAVTLEIVADPRPQHMAGFQELRPTTVQADCWSLDRKEARDLREALIAAIAPAAIVGGTRFGRSFVTRSDSALDETDAKDIVYRESIDFAVWHAPSN